MHHRVNVLGLRPKARSAKRDDQTATPVATSSARLEQWVVDGGVEMTQRRRPTEQQFSSALFECR